jgi:putative ubiquitin-RnfH superfamily antitoxin RatB of RatAB toxin-antitoxin module
MQINDKTDLIVEVAYALPHAQLIISFRAKMGITAEGAIRTSGILEKFPEINLAHHQIGIFGKPTRLDTQLRHMDRVEIYRKLLADPKVMRKQRVANRIRMK